MEIINRVQRMASQSREIRARGERISLVPTMGALHEGHLSLMSRAREMSDVVVASIFVNPAQFGPNEDFVRYPRDLAHDAELAFTRGVDFIFAPAPEEMYPGGFSSYITVEGLSDKLEGARRPGHFKGVTTAVNKLFNVVTPHFAVFGRKDAQQVIVIKRMVRDLAMEVEIVVGPTVREEDGLALSSRNVYLSTEERKAATVLRRSLERCHTQFTNGERDASKMVAAIKSVVESEPHARLDYVAITDTDRLDPRETIPSDTPTLVSIAGFFGSARLIDNIVLNGEI
jgi:pantoate--beta-alanine ligase